MKDELARAFHISPLCIAAWFLNRPTPQSSGAKKNLHNQKSLRLPDELHPRQDRRSHARA